MAVTDYTQTKQCSKCKEVKLFDNFYNIKSSKDGKRSICKVCTNKDNFEWRKNNIEKTVADRRTHYLNNIVRHKELGQIWRNSNKEKIKKLSFEWYEKNKERLKPIRSIYRDSHRQERRLESAIRYRKMPEKYMDYWRKRRALKQLSNETFSAIDLNDLYIKQKNKCAICKINLNKNYHADHITPLSKGGSNGIKNIQILCRNCNLKKSNKDPIKFMQEQGFLL